MPWSWAWGPFPHLLDPTENQKPENSAKYYSSCENKGKKKPLLQKNWDNLAHCMQSNFSLCLMCAHPHIPSAYVQTSSIECALQILSPLNRGLHR